MLGHGAIPLSRDTGLRVSADTAALGCHLKHAVAADDFLPRHKGGGRVCACVCECACGWQALQNSVTGTTVSNLPPTHSSVGCWDPYDTIMGTWGQTDLELRRSSDAAFLLDLVLLVVVQQVVALHVGLDVDDANVLLVVQRATYHQSEPATGEPPHQPQN